MMRVTPIFRTTVILLAALAGVGASPVLADPSMTVKGALVDAEVQPERGYSHKFVVVNDGDVPMDVFVEARGFGQALDGAFQALTPDNDVSQYSSRDYVTAIDNPSFLLSPGSSQTVTAYFDIPSDPGNGSRYAILYVYSPSLQSAGTGFVPSIDVPVILTVSAPPTLEMTGGISDLSVEQPTTPGGPFTIRTTCSNSGNHHFKAFNAIALLNSSGTVLATASSELTRTSVIPMYAYQFVEALTTGTALPEGTYTIQSRFIREDGAELDIRSITFEHVPMEDGGVITVRWFIVGGSILLVLLIALLLMLVTRRRGAHA